MVEHDTAHRHPHYVVIWYWLVGLALVSVVVSSLPVPQALATVLIFAAAVVKALLVALYYMHLRSERLLLYALVLVPLVFLATLVLVLLPDIAGF
jgi:cytochrome c oxidase subunit IV